MIRYKAALLLGFSIILLIISCSKESEINDSDLTEYDLMVIDYFKEIALGFEIGIASKITRKWGNDMKIYISGQKEDELVEELNKIVYELNQLSTDGFGIKIVEDSLSSNYHLFLGTGKQYGQLYPSHEIFTRTNVGLFTVSWDRTNHINHGHMYVDIERSDKVIQKHLLREELTQSLGLGNDSPLYIESIFQSASTMTTDFAQIDRDLIRLLYHPKMVVGLDDLMSDKILREILISEK